MGSSHAQSLTPALAFENSSNLLALTRKEKNLPILIITKLLKECLEFLKHNLTLSQMADYAKMFVINNPSLKLDEVILILSKGMNGDFGKHLGYFDYQVLTNWRGAYEKGERARYLENKNYTPSVGDTARRSPNGESFGAIAKDAIEKINNDKSKFKENDALKNYKKNF